MKGTLLPLLLVAVAGAAAFGLCLGNDFLWDDFPFIFNNLVLDDLGNIPLFLSEGDAVGLGFVNPYYRPVTTITFALGKALWGDDPSGFHAVNLLFHLITCVLLYLVARRLIRDPRAALAGALLFAVHPAHAQPVAYISARADLLCGMFLAASLLAFLHAYPRDEEGASARPALGPLALSLALFALALLSKVVGVVFPILLAAALWGRRGGWRRFLVVAPYLAVTVGFLALRSTVLEMESWGAVTLAQRVATTAYTFGENLKHSLLPWTLHVFNQEGARSSFLDPAVLGGGAAFLALLALVWLGFRRAPVAGLGGAWFVAALLPVSGLAGIIYPSMVADRYLYIPLMGGALAAAAVLDRILARGPSLSLSKAGAVALAVVVAGMAAFSAYRVTFWRDSVVYWSRAVSETGGSGLTLHNLGTALAGAGRFDEAREAYIQAIARGADRAPILTNLGRLSFEKGNIPVARDFAQLAIEASPGRLGPLLLLAECVMAMGESEGAYQLLVETKRLHPFRREVDEAQERLGLPPLDAGLAAAATSSGGSAP